MDRGNRDSSSTGLHHMGSGPAKQARVGVSAIGTMGAGGGTIESEADAIPAGGAPSISLMAEEEGGCTTSWQLVVNGATTKAPAMLRAWQIFALGRLATLT